MAFGAEDVKAADVGNAGAELYIGAAACHVGGDGNIAAHRAIAGLMLLAGLFDDDGFAGVLLGVEDFMLDAVFFGKSRRKRLAFFDADRADKDRPALPADLVDLLDDGVEFFLHRFIDQVVRGRRGCRACWWGYSPLRACRWT